MIRLLFWIILIAAAFWLWRRINRPASPASRPAPEHDAPPMVRCAHCSVHVPKDKALPHDGQWFCSQPHRDQHQP